MTQATAQTISPSLEYALDTLDELRVLGPRKETFDVRKCLGALYELRWDAEDLVAQRRDSANREAVQRPWKPIDRLDGLELASGLSFLMLVQNQVESLLALAGLTRLGHLDLSGNAGLRDLTPLGGLSGLRTLVLENTLVTDLAPLARLSSLVSLSLKGGAVVDVGPLASLSGLTTLNLKSTQVADVRPLASVRGLKEVNLAATPVTDLRPLLELTQLTKVYVSGMGNQLPGASELAERGVLKIALVF